MKITPVDIVHKSFNKKMMGYDQDEVHEFLGQLGATIENLLQERNSLREALREKELTIMEYKNRDQVLQSTINNANHMTEKIRSDAEREAKIILTDAQNKADFIIRDSRDSLKKVYNDISELKKVRLQFEANLKALAQAHLSILEQGEKYMPQPQIPNLNFLSNSSEPQLPTTPPPSGKLAAQVTTDKNHGISPLSAT